jgi:hypothetical protein
VSPEKVIYQILAALEVSALEPENAPSVVRQLHDRLVAHDAAPIEKDDVIYIRLGEHGVRIAHVSETGAGKDAGMLFVRPWNERGRRFMARRWVPLTDERGWPSCRDPRWKDVNEALRKEQS